MGGRRALIAGNWKMYGRRAALAEIPAVAERIGAAGERLDVLICPPFPLIPLAAEAAEGGPVLVGAQDCAANPADAAQTGDVNAAMLADAGAGYVILGHSERRTLRGEADALVREKTSAALAAGLAPIVCVGETREQRAAGQAGAVVAAQLAGSIPDEAPAALVVAYEPVWAIGGDRTPSLEEIADIHALIRAELTGRFGTAKAEAMRILYGGSVNAKNAGEIFRVANVDGALVGRASLNAADFAAIILAHPAA